jgi:hypothetical protein
MVLVLLCPRTAASIASAASAPAVAVVVAAAPQRLVVAAVDIDRVQLVGLLRGGAKLTEI